MKCDECLLNLEEYVDGELDQPTQCSVTAHLSFCKPCQQAHQELRQEQALFACYERNLEISPALWTGIKARLDAEKGTVSPSRLDRLSLWVASLFHTPQLSPVFAVLLVCLAVGVTVWIMKSNHPQPKPEVSQREIPTKTSPVPPIAPGNEMANNQGGVRSLPTQVPVPVRTTSKNKQNAVPKKKVSPEMLVHEAEQKYLAAINLLQHDVNQRRSQLNPQVIARLDSTLQAIDRTITDTRLFVKNNPSDPIAVQYMLTAYSKKIEVLREMAGSTAVIRPQERATTELPN